MRTLTLRNHVQGNSTVIENEFIDIYMTKANGEYVKVYLLLLRYLSTADANLTISKLADCLDCTEKDILRALNYWSGVGLLKIEYDDAGLICAISMGKASELHSGKEVTPSFTEVTPPPAEVPVTPAKPPKTEAKVLSNDDRVKLKQLYFVTEQYFGKPLSHTDMKKINYFFETLQFSVDLIEYLIEYCVENGHKSMHYIESVARAWSEKNIKTVTDAKQDSMIYNKNCFMILNTFGIKGRSPAELELNYIKKWTEEYRFTLEIILEACNRTIANTHQPDFKYTDSILKSWQSKNVRTLSDITQLDLEHQRSKDARKRANAQATTAPSNRFNNFSGRSYDISSLEQQLLNSN